MMKPIKKKAGYKTSLLIVFSSFSLSAAVTTFRQPKNDTSSIDRSFQTTEQSSSQPSNQSGLAYSRSSSSAPAKCAHPVRFVSWWKPIFLKRSASGTNNNMKKEKGREEKEKEVTVLFALRVCAL
jgi:hypothetical protein